MYQSVSATRFCRILLGGQTCVLDTEQAILFFHARDGPWKTAGKVVGGWSGPGISINQEIKAYVLEHNLQLAVINDGRTDSYHLGDPVDLLSHAREHHHGISRSKPPLVAVPFTRTLPDLWQTVLDPQLVAQVLEELR